MTPVKCDVASHDDVLILSTGEQSRTDEGQGVSETPESSNITSRQQHASRESIIEENTEPSMDNSMVGELESIEAAKESHSFTDCTNGLEMVAHAAALSSLKNKDEPILNIDGRQSLEAVLLEPSAAVNFAHLRLSASPQRVTVASYVSKTNENGGPSNELTLEKELMSIMAERGHGKFRRIKQFRRCRSK